MADGNPSLLSLLCGLHDTPASTPPDQNTGDATAGSNSQPALSPLDWLIEMYGRDVTDGSPENLLIHVPTRQQLIEMLKAPAIKDRRKALRIVRRFYQRHWEAIDYESALKAHTTEGGNNQLLATVRLSQKLQTASKRWGEMLGKGRIVREFAKAMPADMLATLRSVPWLLRFVVYGRCAHYVSTMDSVPTDDIKAFVEGTVEEWASELLPPRPNDSAYVGAADLWRAKFKTYPKFKAFIDKIPETTIRRRSPRSNRLEIHAADWAKYWASVDSAQFDHLDRTSPPPLTPDEPTRETIARYVETRAAKEAKGTARRRK